jgi:hypothetical protein
MNHLQGLVHVQGQANARRAATTTSNTVNSSALLRDGEGSPSVRHSPSFGHVVLRSIRVRHISCPIRYLSFQDAVAAQIAPYP